MKIEFLEKLLAMLKKNKVEEQPPKEQFTGYNTEERDLMPRGNYQTEELLDVPRDGYTSLSRNGLEVITKEQAVNEAYKYIQEFLKTNAQVVPKSNITESEWRLFLEIAYDQFVLNGLQAGYTSFMQIGIRYTFYQQFLYDSAQITLQDVLENFDLSMLPPGVANNLAENIRKEVYFATRKDNIIDFQEYRNVKKGK